MVWTRGTEINRITLGALIILDYPGGPSAITRVLISERGRQQSQCQRKRFKDRSVSQTDMGEGPGPRNAGDPKS